MSKQPTVADYIVGRLATRGDHRLLRRRGGLRLQAQRCRRPEREDSLDWLFERTGRGVCGRWVRTHARLLDADDHVRGRRVVRTQRRDGSQGRAVMRLPPRRHADDAQSASRQDHPPHARRRDIPELREHLGAGGLRFGGYHSRQLRPRDGTVDRHGAGGEPSRLHPRRGGLRHYAGHGYRPRPRIQNPPAAPTSPRPPRQSPSGFKPHDPWPCSPPTPSRGSSSNEAYRR